MANGGGHHLDNELPELQLSWAESPSSFFLQWTTRKNGEREGENGGREGEGVEGERGSVFY